MGVRVGSVFMKLGNLTDANQVTVDAITLFVALICACIVIGHLLEKNRWFNESITALLIGLGTGTLILLTSGGRNSRILEFDEKFFFIYLLPPIIFNAGFQVKKKQFFRNFMNIMLFGAVGTVVSFITISIGASQLFKHLNIGFLEMGDSLAIGAILSATDSVCTLQVLNQDETPLLYSLVFGEGVVNDATSVVLFNAIQKFDVSQADSLMFLQFLGNFFTLFITSTLLGILEKVFFGPHRCALKAVMASAASNQNLMYAACELSLADKKKIFVQICKPFYLFLQIGLLCAYVIKKLYFGRHSTDREVALMALMAYLSYVMAELFDLSGIITVFFCGIVMSHYTWHNVTESSRVTTKHGFATLSFVCEILIFLYVGMDALDIEKWRFVSDSPGKSISVSSVLFGLVLVGRAAFVFPLSFLINLSKNSNTEKIDFRQQVTIWWAGLIRGSVSMALAYSQFTRSGHTQLPANAVLITSTITIVLFSTLVFGMLTKPLVRFLLPPTHSSNMISSEPSSPKSLTLPLLGNKQDPEADAGNHDVPRPTSLRMLLSTPTNTVHYYWRKFDDSFMRPMFGGRGFVPVIPGTPIERSAYELH